MTTVWSRWLLGAWAVATAVWLMVATLMLVQMWPEPSLRSAEEAPLGQMGAPSRFDRAMRGQVGTATSVQQHIATILLVALLPPGILLMLVFGGMRFAGLPLPSLRRAAQEKSSRAKS
jgi:hypothetical protein